MRLKKKLIGEYFLYSANRLQDGKVVYFYEESIWKENPKEATQIKRLEISKYEPIVLEDEKNCLIINPYLVELCKNGKIKKLREQIREKGIKQKFK